MDASLVEKTPDVLVALTLAVMIFLLGCLKPIHAVPAGRGIDSRQYSD